MNAVGEFTEEAYVARSLIQIRVVVVVKCAFQIDSRRRHVQKRMKCTWKGGVECYAF